MQEDKAEEEGGNGNLKAKVSGGFLELQLAAHFFMFSNPAELLWQGPMVGFGRLERCQHKEVAGTCRCINSFLKYPFFF